MNRERMLLLKQALVEQDKTGVRFNMSNWGQSSGADYYIAKEILDSCEDDTKKIAGSVLLISLKEIDCFVVTPESKCTTAACALGTAALYDPLFQQGLTMVNLSCGMFKAATMEATILFDKYTDIEAGSVFFEISFSESEYLFDPRRYVEYVEEEESIQISDVIERVDELLAKDHC